jgi:glycosyltransferase involved in cell wall biosynthesis
VVGPPRAEPLLQVSVVIPTKNRLGYVRRAVHLAQLQQVEAMEIIVVDDGGDDGTPAFVASLGDPRIKLVRHEQSRGVSAARNSGIEAATGEWVAFTDDDDMWAPRKLSVQLAALRADQSARWSSVGCVEVGEEWQVFTVIRPPRHDVVRQLLARNVIPGGGSGTVVARDLLERVGRFDEQLSTLADWDMWIRCAMEAPMAPVDEPLVLYLRHPGNMSLNPSHSRYELEHIDRKHAAARAREGVPGIDVSMLRWLGRAQARAGERGPAVRSLGLVAWRQRSLRPIPRAIAAALGPHAYEWWQSRAHYRTTPRDTPPDALAAIAEVRCGLAEVAAADVIDPPVTP